MNCDREVNQKKENNNARKVEISRGGGEGGKVKSRKEEEEKERVSCYNIREGERQGLRSEAEGGRNSVME